MVVLALGRECMSFKVLVQFGDFAHKFPQTSIYK